MSQNAALLAQGTDPHLFADEFLVHIEASPTLQPVKCLLVNAIDKRPCREGWPGTLLGFLLPHLIA